MRITSVQNPRVKDAVRLRDRRGRERQGRLIIDGRREVERALAAGLPLIDIFVRDDVAAEQLGAIPRGQCIELPETLFAKLAYGDRSDGVVAVAETPRVTLRDIVPGDLPLVAVLDGIEKPGNVGAILRTADAAGIDAVVICDGGTDLYNPNAIRASLGAIFTLPVCAASGQETRDWLKQQGMQAFAARVDGSISYTAADYRQAAALVLGSEAAGLGDNWAGEDVIAVRLPMRGAADSLNVSATAAVLFYEALRQRDAH